MQFGAEVMEDFNVRNLRDENFLLSGVLRSPVRLSVQTPSQLKFWVYKRISSFVTSAAPCIFGRGHSTVKELLFPALSELKSGRESCTSRHWSWALVTSEGIKLKTFLLRFVRGIKCVFSRVTFFLYIFNTRCGIWYCGATNLVHLGGGTHMVHVVFVASYLVHIKTVLHVWFTFLNSVHIHLLNMGHKF